MIDASISMKADAEEVSKMRVKRYHYITDQIKVFNVNHDTFRVALCLQIIHNEKLYLDGGFKNVSEYGKKLLGMKTMTINNYVRVARKFLDPTTGTSIFSKNGEDFGYTQLVSLLKLDPYDAKELFASGRISYNMSARDIKKTVDSYIEEKQREATEEMMSQLEPYEASYEEFHAAYNRLKEYLEDKSDVKGQELLQEIMNAVVIFYNEKVR